MALWVRKGPPAAWGCPVPAEVAVSPPAEGQDTGCCQGMMPSPADQCTRQILCSYVIKLNTSHP